MSTDRVQEYLSTIPVVTKVLLLFNCCIHAVIFFTSFPLDLVAINPVMVIVRGEYYRLVSSAFVHSGILHIAMNMSSLLAIGAALENRYGTVKMLFLTLWALVLSGTIFVTLVWCYAWASGQPGELNTSAVGYSGVLFCYALVEAFHSAETSRSVFGLFSVPTKAYPFILLVLIQIMMPNISWWGHLSGLLVGVILISRPGADLLMPSSECMAYLDASSCCRPLSLLGGFVQDKDRTLVHPYLDCTSSSGSSSSGTVTAVLGALYTAVACVLTYIFWALLFVWQLIAAVLTVAGVPAGALSRVENACTWAKQRILDAIDLLGALLCRCQWTALFAQANIPGAGAGGQGEGGGSSGRLWWSNGYSPIATQEGDLEAAVSVSPGTTNTNTNTNTVRVPGPAPSLVPTVTTATTVQLGKGAKKPQDSTTVFV